MTIECILSLENLGFYILNAVSHDFIHDFNNYGRMAKILNYIAALVSESMRVSDASEPIREIGDILKAAEATEVGPTKIEPPIRLTTGPEEKEEDDTGDWNALVESQSDQYLKSIGENIEVTENIEASINIRRPETLQQELVNRSIRLFGIIQTRHPGGDGRATRANIKKINLLQQITEFIGESKLLAISKLTTLPASTAASGRKGGSKQQKGGASAIDIITTDDMSLSIFSIIKEIEETPETHDFSNNDKRKLISIFELMDQVFINFTIPGISPLEKFNNSLITEILSMFIINNCESINIQEESKLYLKALIPSPPVEPSSLSDEPVARGVSQVEPSSSQDESVLPLVETTSDEIVLPQDEIDNNGISPILTNLSPKKDDDSPPSPRSVADIRGGAGLTNTIYRDSANQALWSVLNSRIDTLKTTDLYTVYSGKGASAASAASADVVVQMNPDNYERYYGNYNEFIRDIKTILELIVGPQMYKIKSELITKYYI
jgi:hypothetical protein